MKNVSAFLILLVMIGVVGVIVDNRRPSKKQNTVVRCWIKGVLVVESQGLITTIKPPAGIDSITIELVK